ncbi:helical backbone metal receptor [Blastococcus xanthinilyticus]|uniref:ABC-type Fe3+-hydroxamate transport system substrate-binding protein n=1 Tax=Blastococcus xanthinilyticus TaxID=1564164 RepID=A0A5S5CZG3_9ACTN|nr:helical backbone metal receptor [Blastococcus xanthinilyticus]TYP88474.1 ABC-type Fe3+-hydroxamate transport system substrate-binding protein [Blastococcus xanthinilyticus]
MPDDLGTPFPGAPPRRVVSLVPSLTEAVAATDPALLAGATDWCTHPADLDVPRVGGTKWPDVTRVLDLAPDLVVANAEENRDEDVAALRAAGVPVWVTAPATVDQALDSLGRLLAALDRPDPGWLVRAREVWADPPRLPGVHAVVPIWRRPWMVLGRDTFAGDVLARLGVRNVFAGSADRYPKLSRDEPGAVPAELVVFPDEPYAFTPDDGPEAWPQARPAFVSGRHLTWYGPSLVEAPVVLLAQLAG